MTSEQFPYHVPRAGVDAEPLMEALPSSEPIEDMEHFVEKLREVGPTLTKAGLPDAFNYVYWELSRRVWLAAQDSLAGSGPDAVTFRHPETVTHTAGIFGEEYFRQLRKYGEYVGGDDIAIDGVIDAWKLTFFHPAVRRPHSDGLQFLAGMKAHIEADLPRALKISGVDNDYYHDYTVPVQHLIRETTWDLAPALVPAPGPKMGRRALAMPMVGHIGAIREVAWQRSMELIGAAEYDQQQNGAEVSLEAALIEEYDRQAAERIKDMLEVGSLPMALGARAVNWANGKVGGEDWKSYGPVVA